MARHLLAAIVIALTSALAQQGQSQTAPPLLPPEGLDNPTLAYGLSGVADYGTSRPFINQMTTARPWFGAAIGDWETMPTDDLIAGGYVDDEGWVTRMPPGIDAIRTIWAYGEAPGAEQRSGTYILTYEGEGSIQLGGDVQRIDGRPGRIVFRTAGGQLWMDLTDIDPRKTGNYLRNIVIVAEDELALHQAGAIFSPAWLKVIRDARVLRYMTWGDVNNSRTQPGELPLIEARGFWMMKRRGIPVSLMVELANTVGAEPWFCMPHLADDAYVTAYADYVYRNLDPSLVAHVEYSNEAWNGSFAQARWLTEQAGLNWNRPNDFEASLAYGAREATRDALIWEDVFGSDATTRLDNVLAGQTVNIWGTGVLLDPKPWQTAEPDSYFPPTAVFDSFAITTYFGGSFVANAALREDLVRRILDDKATARTWLTEQLMSADVPDTVASNEVILRAQADLAQAAGLRLVAYEGGQHLHHAFAVAGLTEEDLAVLTDFMLSYTKGPEMAAQIALNWDVWSRASQGPYMQFGDVGAGSKWGSFSAYEAPGLSNPMAEVLEQRNASTIPWWPTTGGARFQQGRTVSGTDGPNALSGTIKTDTILAGAGDDLIQPGPGNDHIHGGDGIDTVLLPDAQAATVITSDGTRLVASGPSGRIRLFAVERLRFADGTEVDAPAP